MFEGFFTIYGRGSHIGHVTQISTIILCLHHPWMFHMVFGCDWLGSFGEKDV